MDEVRKKVLLAIFAAPSSLLPIVAGVSAWLLSWALDGNIYLNLGGLAGVLGGVGLMAYRLAFDAERITARVFAAINDARHRQREAELDALEARLRGDRDPRTQTYLRQLRGLYREFQEGMEQGRASPLARTVLGDVENLFQASVKHLETAYQLWETASHMSGDAKRATMEDREQVVQEVERSAELLSKTVEQFQSFRAKEDETEFARLRQELDETMQAARRAEQRVAALGKSAEYNIREFE